MSRVLLTARFAIPCLSISVALSRAVAGLITNFLSYPVIREVFGSKAECKARLQGFVLSQKRPPRLEESGSIKRTRGGTLVFVALHTSTTGEKESLGDYPEGG
jgi:hypothetical protein